MLIPLLKKQEQAADESRWHDYVNAMGGVFAKRKDQPLRLAYDNAVNTETGECKLGHYDGNFIQTIKGLLYEGQDDNDSIFQLAFRKNKRSLF